MNQMLAAMMTRMDGLRRNGEGEKLAATLSAKLKVAKKTSNRCVSQVTEPFAFLTCMYRKRP